MHIKPILVMGIAAALLALSPAKAYTQGDSLYLSVDQLFEKGMEQNLQLAADRLREKMAEERRKTARTGRLPDIEIGLNRGIRGTARHLRARTLRSHLSRLARLVAELCGEPHAASVPWGKNKVCHTPGRHRKGDSRPADCHRPG